MNIFINKHLLKMIICHNTDIFALQSHFDLIWSFSRICLGFPGGSSGKEPTCQCRRPKRHQFDLWVRKIPWRRKWQPTPVFLPGESHAKRSPLGYSPQDHKELDMTEQLTLSHFHHLTLRTSFAVEELLLLQTLKCRLHIWRGRGKLPFLPLIAMSCHSPSFC